ncbi:hypothetical protein Poli38472_014156 [Pythium oligandrum]|uniref:C2H2-type domain-containing protein n=1 Tax=Pythium oligandrum TaxID=41045 RepID=A0A8K1CJ74_PYTOL|nr:hypothetical protein Poli38472_014156 [Pythium oligandrum]|eukprot:TMW64039.1 hypothetical protein Poli38472_014156 [Pythium oligandrum]
MLSSGWDPEADLRPILLKDLQGDNTAPKTATIFVCTYPGCGKQFQLKGNLKRHQNIHRGDKQFKCDVCGREFLRKADMEVHQRVHTGEKPYLCKFEDCDKRFARRSDLLSHERTHSGKKPFLCDYPECGRRFARRFDLHKHQRMHDGDCEEGATKANKKRPLAQTTATSSAAVPTAIPSHYSKVGQFMTQLSSDRAPTPRSPARQAPISPSDHMEGPGKDRQFELTCTLDHEHFADCFTAESWDAMMEEAGMSSSSSTESCCTSHLPNGKTKRESPSKSPSIKAETKHSFVSQLLAKTSPPTVMSPKTSVPTASTSAPLPASTACPIVATAKLHDYAAHTSCGHLAIQHGDHRDFVVKNHLVCLDNVKSLSGNCSSGACVPISGTKSTSTAPAATTVTTTAPPTDRQPRHPHRPGCGHLPVRHGDHIDYVVDDGLFCQQAGFLDDADHIELLGDDFWEFYGAIGSLNTDE